jgi:protein-disulfide isomerase
MLLGVFGLFLVACGAYAPPAPTRSAVEERQTARALAGAPTLVAGAGMALPTAIAQPTPDRSVLTAPPDDPRALGDPNAPITVVEFSDFE